MANTLHAASGRIAAMLVWLLFTPPILRMLGAQGFAVWALFYALTGYLSALDFGLVQGTLRHVAGARERGDRAAAGAFATLGAVGYVGLGILWLAVALLLRDGAVAWLRIPPDAVPDARLALLAGAGVFVLAGVTNVVMAVLQACGRFDLANLTMLVMSVQQAAGFWLVIRRGWGFEGLVANAALGWGLGGLVGAVLLARGVPWFGWGSWGASVRRLREALGFGGPMQIASVLGVLNTHLDKFLLPRFVVLAAVAPYELGSRVALAASSLPQLLLLAVLPEAAAIHAAGDRARLRELYDRGSRYLLTATVVAVAPLLGAAGRLFDVWVGIGHGDAALALRLLAAAAWVSLSTGMGTTVARAAGRTDLEAWFGAVAVAVHLLLSLMLMPVLGLVGALAAAVAAVAVGAALFDALLARAMGWTAREVFGPCAVPVLATLAGAAAGVAVDRALPAALGPAGWALLAVAAAAASVTALAVSIATGYLGWREAWSLLAQRVRDVGGRA